MSEYFVVSNGKKIRIKISGTPNFVTNRLGVILEFTSYESANSWIQDNNWEQIHGPVKLKKEDPE